MWRKRGQAVDPTRQHIVRAYVVRSMFIGKQLLQHGHEMVVPVPSPMLSQANGTPKSSRSKVGHHVQSRWFPLVHRVEYILLRDMPQPIDAEQAHHAVTQPIGANRLQKS